MRAAVAVALLSLTVAGCSSSQAKSARLAKGAAKRAVQGRVTAGPANRSVEVTGTQVLTRDGATAAVVTLRNTGARAQAQLPVQIKVLDRRGRPVYANDLEGLQPALQQMAYLGARARAYWVHDQVVADGTPRRLRVRVGRAPVPAPPGPPPRIVLRGLHLAHDTTGVFATGRVENRSRLVQRNMPIFAVARRGGRVIAAGRAIIERLDPAPQPKPTVFRIFFVGDPRGATLDVRPAPTVLEGR